MSTLGIPSLGRFELAARVVLDGATGSWFVVGLEDHEAASILGDEIESIAEESVAMVPVNDRDSLVAASHDHASGLAIFYAAVPLEALHLDAVRSNLQRERAAVLAVPPHQLTRIASISPHFTSWAGNRVFLVEEDRFLDQEAIEARLKAIRTHYGMNDEEFLEMVQRRDVPLEPEHDAFDLVGGRRNPDRDPRLADLRTPDSGWLFFAAIVRPVPSGLQIVAYDVERVFGPYNHPAWVRFDLNALGHPNDQRGIRSHFHANNDDLQLHAPIFAPHELIEILLSDLGPQQGRKPRRKGIIGERD